MRLECLTPDFNGTSGLDGVATVATAGLDVYAHNIETVERLQSTVRDRRAGYRESIAVLEHARAVNPDVVTKTSIILGACPPPATRRPPPAARCGSSATLLLLCCCYCGGGAHAAVVTLTVRVVVFAAAAAASPRRTGFGEEEAEIRQTMRDMRTAGVEIFTLGQYLRPSRRHMKVATLTF